MNKLGLCRRKVAGSQPVGWCRSSHCPYSGSLSLEVGTPTHFSSLPIHTCPSLCTTPLPYSPYWLTRHGLVPHTSNAPGYWAQANLWCSAGSISRTVTFKLFQHWAPLSPPLSSPCALFLKIYSHLELSPFQYAYFWYYFLLRPLPAFPFLSLWTSRTATPPCAQPSTW